MKLPRAPETLMGPQTLALRPGALIISELVRLPAQAQVSGLQSAVSPDESILSSSNSLRTYTQQQLRSLLRSIPASQAERPVLQVRKRYVCLRAKLPI